MKNMFMVSSRRALGHYEVERNLGLGAETSRLPSCMPKPAPRSSYWNLGNNSPISEAAFREHPATCSISSLSLLLTLYEKFFSI